MLRSLLPLHHLCLQKQSGKTINFFAPLLFTSIKWNSSTSTKNLVPTRQKQQRKSSSNFKQEQDHSRNPYFGSADHKRELYAKESLNKILGDLKKIGSSMKQNRYANNKNNRKNNTYNNRRNNSHQNQKPAEQFLFQNRQKFSELSMRLTSKQFHQMSLRDLSFLLQLTSSLVPVNGASHIASGISSALPAKLEEADIYESTEYLIQLLNILKHAAHNKAATNRSTRGQQNYFERNRESRMMNRTNTGFDLISDDDLIHVVDSSMQRLIEHFAEATERNRQQEKEEEIARKNQNNKEEDGTTNDSNGSTKSSTSNTNNNNNTNHQQKKNAVAYYDDSTFRRRVILQVLSKSNDKRLEHLFREEYLRALIELVLTDAKAFNINTKTSSLQGSSSNHQDEKEGDQNSNNNNNQTKQSNTTAPQLSALVAIVATSICRLRILNPTVVDFFKWAAPICVAEVDLLSGNQLSYILDAFSMVGYHHPALFVTLGGKAGELGELLREDEVARILIALDRTKIDHSKLRASLESSMRMRNLHKRSPTLGGLF